MPRPLIFIAAAALTLVACSPQPQTCEEVADASIALTQDLIDELEAEVDEADVEDLINTMLAGEDLPSVERFKKEAAGLSDRAGELGCTQEQLQADVAARADHLVAATRLGELIIWAVENGGL